MNCFMPIRYKSRTSTHEVIRAQTTSKYEAQNHWNHGYKKLLLAMISFTGDNLESGIIIILILDMCLFLARDNFR